MLKYEIGLTTYLPENADERVWLRDHLGIGVEADLENKIIYLHLIDKASTQDIEVIFNNHTARGWEQYK